MTEEGFDVEGVVLLAHARDGFVGDGILVGVRGEQADEVGAQGVPGVGSYPADGDGPDSGVGLAVGDGLEGVVGFIAVELGEAPDDGLAHAGVGLFKGAFEGGE